LLRPETQVAVQITKHRGQIGHGEFYGLSGRISLGLSVSVICGGHLRRAFS
jgi:hypothetical protein